MLALKKRAACRRRDFACKSNCALVSPTGDSDCQPVVMHKLLSFPWLLLDREGEKRRAPCPMQIKLWYIETSIRHLSLMEH